MIRFIYFLLFLAFSFSQTTGKISGIIYDAETGEPIIGANIVVVGTDLGASSDTDGSFFIININPGTYSLKVHYIGYAPLILNQVSVSVNRTNQLEPILIEQSSIEGETIQVTVDASNIKKDQTGTVKNISSDQINMLPVENIDAVINMQAGVVANHFRGGRSTEVTYLVDGIRVDEGFSGEGQAVSIEPDAVSELEVITGTFNAEYGKAMSGVVNQVTKSGSNNFEGSVTYSYSNYFSNNDHIFPGIDQSELNRNNDIRFQLSGPILKDKLFFFLNARRVGNNNHLNGYNYFSSTDLSDYTSDNPSDWFSEHSGDSSMVAMNTSENTSLMGKLLYQFSSKFKSSFLFTLNFDKWYPYYHNFLYNPSGMAHTERTTSFYAWQSNYMFSKSLFIDFKYSLLKYYNGYYVYENPLSDEYVSSIYFQDVPGFYTGGQEKSHSTRETLDHNLKMDATWQINKFHSLKAGMDLLFHNINNEYYTILNYYNVTSTLISPEDYQAYIFPADSLTTYNDVFDVSPSELSLYIQDKMEFDAMVINLGLRFDRFNPNVMYPSEYRNPLNLINEVEQSDYLEANIQTQLSPRLGIAYQVSDEAVMRFSYGHFFQMPPFYAMYNRSDWLVSTGDFQTVMGNPNLSAEKTVKYEIGVWQKINRNVSFDVNLYYKDIYDLLSTEIITTFNNVKYGLYTNKDYGNVRGLELKLDMLYENVSIMTNYTLQFTRGIADNPTYGFGAAANNEDPVNKLIPMSWDQRHTFNISVGYNTPSYGISAVSYFNSGTAYTFEPPDVSVQQSTNTDPNNEFKPSSVSVDIRGHYSFSVYSNIKIKLGFSIYNLFDRLNEVNVYNDTGRAYTTQISDSEISTYRSTFSSIEDVYQNPAMYSAPRNIKFTLGIVF